MKIQLVCILVSLAIVFSQNCDRFCFEVFESSNSVDSTFQNVIAALKSLRQYTVRFQNAQLRLVDGAAFENNLYYGWEFHVGQNQLNTTEILAGSEEIEERCDQGGAKRVIYNVINSVAGITNATVIRGCR
eukprot:TRINITY_DN3883_c0_g1_i1.p1 TRINITY_DN3883_c0_g1~~TRINITY_DN3883_c0_g1_i1.p1  ORF type:complete len:131 (-),score=12.07 TRINITY_DN3883_c0_g1_i1:107-499(-)